MFRFDWQLKDSISAVDLLLIRESSSVDLSHHGGRERSHRHEGGLNCKSSHFTLVHLTRRFDLIGFVENLDELGLIICY